MEGKKRKKVELEQSANVLVTETLCSERVQHIEDVITLGFEKLYIRLEGMDKALDLKSKDLENRLHLLNQLREEVIRDRQMFLVKETYDIKTAGYDAWCSSVDKKIATIETRIVTWTSAVIGFFAILQFILHYLVK